MNITNVAIIGGALAMDACGVALSIGINCQVTTSKKIRFILAFAFFQFFLAFVGAVADRYINSNIFALPSVIGGIAIVLVGLMMLKEGAEDQSDCILIRPFMEIILGISVSIDALVVGFTGLYSRGNAIFTDGLLIGFITLILVTLAFLCSRILRKTPMVTKYADYLGGFVLVLFGLKMVFL